MKKIFFILMLSMTAMLYGCAEETYKLNCVEISDTKFSLYDRNITVLVNDKPVKLRTNSQNIVNALSVGQLVNIIYSWDFSIINITIAQNCDLDGGTSE